MSVDVAQVLLPHHLEQLRASCISDPVIAARDYQSIPETGGYSLLKKYGFSKVQAKNGAQGGLILPLWTPTGDQPVVVLKPDHPREDKDGRPRKYEIPNNARVRIDSPPICHPMLGDQRIPIWITEGQKKGDSLASCGVCVIALLSVWGFKGKNDIGGLTVVADLDEIAWNGRDVRIVFDSDVVQNRSVSQALERLTQVLTNRKANVRAIYLPTVDGKKVGVDDYFAAGHTLADLEALIEMPRPEPQPAPPAVEILDEAPKTMSKPLVLIGGEAYAATWLYTRETRTETLDKAGNIIKLNPPKVVTERRLFIVRGQDGRVFGVGGDETLDTLDIDVHLPEIPPPDKLWSAAGVKAYLAGARPHPADVFKRSTDVIDRYMDFDRSLASQKDMCEMVACFALSTWFLDAFTVVGYLWPTGGSGSGKTLCITIVAEIAYLGQVILASGSLASLRDLADYGATLAFDDAENLSDPRKVDPDKRALLLAGNRKGNTIPLKELRSNNTWQTRHVNTFCVRLFSAIRVPDDVLSSRTIVVPLVRSADKGKSNSEPLDFDTWPSDRKRLLDDLWSMGLAYLPQIPNYATHVSQDAPLSGRNLQPWLPLLSVALWLQEHGCEKLYDRMCELAKAYTEHERPTLQVGNLTPLVIRALIACAGHDLGSIRAFGSVGSINKETPPCEANENFKFSTKAITDKAAEVAREEEWDIKIETVESRRVGRCLGQLRLKKQGKTSTRAWEFEASDLYKLAVAYGMISSARESKKGESEGGGFSDDEKNEKNAQNKPGPLRTNAPNAPERSHAPSFESGDDAIKSPNSFVEGDI
jgi:hypothetical protein